jgi:hypothetical protein
MGLRRFVLEIQIEPVLKQSERLLLSLRTNFFNGVTVDFK